MNSMLDKLAEDRTPILLNEIGAYLHLIGRFSEEFISAQAKDATESEKIFKYEKVYNNSKFFENTGLDGLLNDKSWEILINAFKNLSSYDELSKNKIKSFSEFFEKHTWHSKPKGLCKILADAHGIVSGIDKALAGRGESGKQRKAYTFRATAFGYEKKIEPENIKKTRRKFYEEIKSVLKNIKISSCISYNDYKNFVKLIKEYYYQTIGETRRPINEISLYDYAYTIASLAKSNLAKMVIDGWQDPKTRDFFKKSSWRILKINIDVVGLMSKGLKIGDILGYRNEIEETYDKIKSIIEFEYPLGNEIYRDSTGIYFSCPDVNDINRLKSEIIDELKELKKPDFSLQIEISDKSRSMVVLAKEREEATKRISYPHIGDTEYLEEEFEKSKKSGGEDICPVCRLRLKPEKEDRCGNCKERYEKRAKTWLDKDSKETIWLDEVADKNDRVALLVGQFDLGKWLSGKFVDTFVSQTFDEWKEVCVDKHCNEKISDVCDKLEIKNILDLEKGFENLFNNPKSLDDNWKKICGSFIGREPNDFIDNFWNPIAERDDTEKALRPTKNSEKAKYLIKLLFRKHPSLSRIYRIWNTTEEFIQSTIFEEVLGKYNWNSELRRQRIQFKIEPNPKIPEGSTCDIDVDGLRFSPVCIDEQNGTFVSTINLEILKKFEDSADEISENLNERRIKVKTDKDITWTSEKNGESFRITEARPANEKFQKYLPYIKIYGFPDQFMVLVPAYDALDITERILNEYEIQFSKVRDRLPFHLGIIAFHRRTPLYVAMDAGKRLIDVFRSKAKTIKAKVKSIADAKQSRFGNYAKELTLEPDSQYSSVPLIWNISYSTGDPNQQDEWHPYIRFYGKNPNRGVYSFDYTGNGNYVVHVKEIQINDSIEIEPSYFYLTFLESAADRFRIGEQLRPLDDIKRLDELWKSIINILTDKHLGISQLYAFRQEVEKRRKDYKGNSVWENFTESSLTNILKVSAHKDAELFKKLFQATKDGLLDLCLYWNLQVRKIKPKKQEAEK